MRKSVLDVAAMAKDYCAGLTTREVAKKYGCHQATAWDRLKNSGVTMRGMGHTKGTPCHPNTKIAVGVAATGEKNHMWNGGRTVSADGYPMVKQKDHPNANKHNGFIAEHRLVMEAAIGRLLKSGESVHHADMTKANNRIDNLLLLRSESAHQRIHTFANRHGIKTEVINFPQPWLKINI